jgi:nucleotide-binding universal stress UspA family protein
MERIVVATDGSPGADAAVTQGVEIARLTGAAVTFVYVRHGIPPVLGTPFYQRKLSAQLRTARAALESAVAEADRQDVDAEAEITEGSAVDEILRAAVYQEADLIVVGSRGLGAVAGALLGSVSKALVELAPMPVLVAREKAPGNTEPAERELTTAGRA